MRRIHHKHRSRSASEHAKPRRRVPKKNVKTKPGANKIAEDLVRLAEDSTDQLKDVVVAVKRSPWLKRGVLVLGFCFGCFVSVLLATYAVLAFVVDEQDVLAFIVDSVQDQTGGRLELAGVSYSIFSGIELRGGRFYAPERSNPIGYSKGGQTEPLALIQFDKVVVHFDTWQTFLAQLSLETVSLEGPSVIVDRDSRGWNFDGIIAYRTENFPPSDVVSNVPPEQGQETSFRDILPILPAKIFMPVGIDIGHVGFSNLSVSVIDQVVGSRTSLEGLSFSSSLSWFGFRSHISMVAKAPRLLVSHSSKDQNINVNANLNFQSSLDDVQVIDQSFKFRINKLTANQHTILNRSIDQDLEILIGTNLDQINLKKLSVNVFDFLRYEGSGTLKLLDEKFAKFMVKLNQSSEVDVFSLGQIVKFFDPSIDMFGSIRMSRFDVEGVVEPAKMSAESLVLPHISGNLAIRDLRLHAPSHGLLVKPINGDLALGGGPSLIGKGSQLDAWFDFESEAVELHHQGQTVVVKNLETKLISRVLYPQFEVPILKVSVGASAIKADSPDFESIEVPLHAEVTADYRHLFEKAALSARVELPQLLNSSIDVRCSKRCTGVRVSHDTELASLAKIFQLVRPVLQSMVSLKDMPETLSGKLALSGLIKGSLPDPFVTKLPELVDRADLDVTNNFELTGIDLAVPARKVSIENLDFKTNFIGDSLRQKLIVNQSFDNLAFELVQKKLRENISITNYSLNSEVRANHDRQPTYQILANPTDMLKNLDSLVSLDLRIGGVATKLLPRPLANIESELTARMKRGSLIELSKFVFNVPDFGANGSLRGDARVNLDENSVEEFRLITDVGIDHGVGKVLTSGVKTSGKMNLKMKVLSDDMAKILVEGVGAFNHFNLEIPDLNNVDQAMVVIENMHGDIPIKQTIDLSTIKEDRNQFASRIDENATTWKNKSSGGVTAHVDDELDLARVKSSYFEKTKDSLKENTNQALMVDYSSIRPFYPGREPLSIGKLSIANLEFKRMEFDVELRQNWFSINQYIVEFLGGKIQGDVQVAFDPAPVALRLTTHLTELDTRKLLDGFPKLKKRSVGWSLLSDPYLDASMHMKYDLRTNDLSGAVEVTAIGKEQLKMILHYIDPKSEDPTIQTIQKALLVGEVKQVSVPIKNGLLGLDVDVRLLSAPIPIPTPELRGFPIGRIVENFAKAEIANIEEPPDRDEALDDTNEEKIDESTPNDRGVGDYGGENVVH